MPVPVRELRAMLVATPPGCTTDSRTGLFAICNSWRRLSEKPRTANFAAAYAVCPGGATMPKIEDRLTMWASRWRASCGRNARVRMHHAPEIDVEQPLHLRLVDLAELAEQRDAGIVDDDVEGGMRRGRGLREGRDLSGSPTSTRCR